MNDILLPGHVSVAEAVRRMGGVEGLRSALLPNTLDREQMKQWHRLRDSHFFLVRNRGGSTGERYRCRRHEHVPGLSEPVYHEYFTTMCVDRPWRGLEGALWAYATISRNDRLASRLDAIAPNALPAHPLTFGPLAPSESEAEVVAVAIGTLEPISESRAQQLAQQITARRPPEPFIL